MFMNSKQQLLCIAGALGVLALGGLSHSNAQVLTNGDFESWGTTTGTPPTGTPTGWVSNGLQPIYGDGLVAGSTHSVIMQAANFSGTANLSQTVTPAATNFQLSMNIASAAVAVGDTRSFQMILSQGGVQYMNMRLTGGTGGVAGGLLTLQIHNGTAWQNVLIDAFNASTFNGAGTGFSTLNAYTFTINANLSGSPSYTITYGLVGGSTTTTGSLNYFVGTPTGSTTTINFASNASQANYALDNVSLTVVPEPSTYALLTLGLGLLFLAHIRSIRARTTSKR